MKKDKILTVEYVVANVPSPIVPISLYSWINVEKRSEKISSLELRISLSKWLHNVCNLLMFTSAKFEMNSSLEIISQIKFNCLDGNISFKTFEQNSIPSADVNIRTMAM